MATSKVKLKARARKLLEGERVLAHGRIYISLEELLDRTRRQLTSAESGKWTVGLQTVWELAALADECHRVLEETQFHPEREADYLEEAITLKDSLKKLTTLLNTCHDACSKHDGRSACREHLKTVHDGLKTLEFIGR